MAAQETIGDRRAVRLSSVEEEAETRVMNAKPFMQFGKHSGANIRRNQPPGRAQALEMGGPMACAAPRPPAHGASAYLLPQQNQVARHFASPIAPLLPIFLLQASIDRRKAPTVSATCLFSWSFPSADTTRHFCQTQTLPKTSLCRPFAPCLALASPSVDQGEPQIGGTASSQEKLNLLMPF
jgi:hypothetical protein